MLTANAIFKTNMYHSNVHIDFKKQKTYYK